MQNNTVALISSCCCHYSASELLNQGQLINFFFRECEKNMSVDSKAGRIDTSRIKKLNAHVRGANLNDVEHGYAFECKNAVL